MNNGTYKQWDVVRIIATGSCGTVTGEQAAINIQEYRLRVKIAGGVDRATGHVTEDSEKWYLMSELERALPV